MLDIDPFDSQVFSETSVQRVLDIVAELKKLTDLGSAYAPFRLSELLYPDSALSDEVKVAIHASSEEANRYAKISFERLTRLRGQDDGKAAFFLATFYQIGFPFVKRSYTLFNELNEEAYRAGFALAKCNLNSRQFGITEATELDDQ